MNDYIVDPNDENLKRLQRFNGGEVYWHTEDFFRFDSDLTDELDAIFEVYMDAFKESEGDDDEVAERRVGFLTAKKIVETARRLGISPRNLRDQFDNFATVVFTPICLWRRDEPGVIHRSLMSNLPTTRE
ncbi:MAG: hypothetical protein N5P05_002778 [Chroococcopsis gigantea SAG 12.99]|jgi:hypothetical protein|nr:hypothetical protein [Chroococcopsis gigantea SAG 12.99]